MQGTVRSTILSDSKIGLVMGFTSATQFTSIEMRLVLSVYRRKRSKLVLIDTAAIGGLRESIGTSVYR